MRSDDVLGDLELQLRAAAARQASRSRPGRRLVAGLAAAAVAIAALVLALPRGGDDRSERAVPAAPPAADRVTVAVLDATTTPGLAGRTADRLEQVGGFRVVATGPAPDRSRDQTLVMARSPREAAAARRVGAVLGVPDVENVASPELRRRSKDADVVVLAGTDAEGWTGYAPLNAACEGQRRTPIGGPVPAALAGAFGVLRRAQRTNERALERRLTLVGADVVSRYAGGLRVVSGFQLIAADVTRRGAAFHRCRPADGPGEPALCLYGAFCATPGDLRDRPQFQVSGDRRPRAYGLAPDGVRAVVFTVGGREHRALVHDNVFDTQFPNRRGDQVVQAQVRYARE